MIGLGGNQFTRGKRVVFERFSAGEFSVRNAVAAISPSLHGDSLDGIAGPVIFSDYSILLSLKKGTDLLLFSMGDPLSSAKEYGYQFAGRVTFPFYLVNKMIILKGRIKDSGNDMDILLDTGAERSLISEAAARKYARLDPRRSGSTGLLTGLGGKVEGLRLARNVEIRLGSLSKNFNEIPAFHLADICEAMELELDLILGQDFLAGYTLLIDYGNRTVTFLW
jgi:hypothetical protein